MTYCVPTEPISTLLMRSVRRVIHRKKKSIQQRFVFSFTMVCFNKQTLKTQQVQVLKQFGK